VTRIINTSSQPYEWTFDSANYGPIQPGEIVDLPQEIAAHAVKRSVVLDPDLGDEVSFRVAFLDSLDKEIVKKIASYNCPFAVTGQCHSKPFKTVDDLRLHLESHWEATAETAKPKR
jgi:hypothetical protein